MEKKFKFSEEPLRAKILYGAVILVLTVTAIVIAIASAANKQDSKLPENETPPLTDGGSNSGENEGGADAGTGTSGYAFPLTGEIAKGHSTEIPVFSVTLGDFRVHTGVDISANEGDSVNAAADGTVARVYYDPFLGQTVEVSHSDGVTSRYSNLDKQIPVKVGDKIKRGDRIGAVGDTSLSELADEVHLHFEITVNGVGVDPIGFIEENKE